MSALLVYFTLIAILGGVIVWPSLYNMVSLWLLTDTYLHGVIVLPMCYFLAKQIGFPEKYTAPRDTTKALLVMAWLISLAVVNQSFFNPLIQLTYLTIVPLSVYCVWGKQGVWHYRAPILLSFLSIPFGDSLIPFLQSFTADMSVWLLNISGVSVWRQGWYISILNADFRVAEACSGVNFLISTIVLSIFFAFIEMSSWKKRAAFVLLGAIIPVLANGFRVYLIIMIAEMGYVEAATGFDHLVYGWIFFVFVLAILMAIGLLMRDKIVASATKDASQSFMKAQPVHSIPVSQVFVAAVLTFALVTIYSKPEKADPLLVSGQGILSPSFDDADHYCFNKFDTGEAHVVTYLSETHSKKMLSINNRWFDGSTWSISDRKNTVSKDGIAMQQYLLSDLSGRKINLFAQYKIGDTYTDKTWLAKLLMWRDNVFITNSEREVRLIAIKDANQIDAALMSGISRCN